VRVAAFLALKRLASANNDTIVDQVLKVGGYRLPVILTYGRSQGNISHSRSILQIYFCIHPSIHQPNEEFRFGALCADHAKAYQHAFGYIRQLAIHLRESMKVKTKARLLVSMHRLLAS
jgi:nucleolar complex protein 2